MIDKISKPNQNFGIKLFLSYIIFTIILIASITTIHVYFSDDLVLTKFEREVKLQSSEKKRIFDTFLDSQKDELIAITKNEYFLEFIEHGNYKYYIDLLLLTIMDANKDYMQMRYIDKHGHEVLRFNRGDYSEEPYKSTILQDKSNRYYFKETSNLKYNEIWYSNIDLNVEHNKVEIPFKPVIRVATPIYIHNHFEGIFIINVFMDDLLKNISKSSLYDIYLSDSNGYFITHTNPKYNWSSYKDKYSVEDEFGKNISLLTTHEKPVNKILDKKIYVQSIELDKQKINMIMVENEQSKQDVQSSNNTMIITILIFATTMSLIFTFMFTRALKGLFELVVKQSDELFELATTLEHKVKIKTLENAKKDRLLQNQSKLAELGDMIGNIAHQWRHPLTRLSLTLQNLKAFKNKGRMNDKLFEDSMENSLYQIEFMSNTIDNFKNFYKKDKKKSDFMIKEAFENVLKIIGSVLDHSNIKLEVNCKEEIELHANKNEFSQVLMNLIINAKDALDEKKIESPSIKIGVYKKEDQVFIEIADNAGGVPDKIIKKIFNPYYTTKKEKGTGIGLYLSKAIIEDKMHGELKVHNDKDGAVFTIIL